MIEIIVFVGSIFFVCSVGLDEFVFMNISVGKFWICNCVVKLFFSFVFIFTYCILFSSCFCIFFSLFDISMYGLYYVV